MAMQSWWGRDAGRSIPTMDARTGGAPASPIDPHGQLAPGDIEAITRAGNPGQPASMPWGDPEAFRAMFGSGAVTGGAAERDRRALGLSTAYGGPVDPAWVASPGDAGGLQPWTPEEAMAQIDPTTGTFAQPGGSGGPMPSAPGDPSQGVLGDPVAPVSLYERGGGPSASGAAAGALGPYGTLGGAVGMGGGSGYMGRLAGGSVGALRGMFGLGGGGGGTNDWGRYMGRQSPAGAYSTSRQSPSTLGGFAGSGYGKQRY